MDTKPAEIGDGASDHPSRSLSTNDMRPLRTYGQQREFEVSGKIAIRQQRPQLVAISLSAFQ